MREAEARVLHVPHCGRDSAGIAPYIALTVLFCPGCALKNNAVQPRSVRRLKLRRRGSRECDLKIPFNFRCVFAAPPEKKGLEYASFIRSPRPFFFPYRRMNYINVLKPIYKKMTLSPLIIDNFRENGSLIWLSF